MKLTIVIPCYNEELVLNETTKQLSLLLDRLIKAKKISTCEILYIDDGSKDNTWSIIKEQSLLNSYVHGIKLAHNVGHQNALWAGYNHTAISSGDFIVSMDADLQHDINAIEQMIDRYKEGYEVVFGIRKNRITDGWFKKKTALSFYSIMQWLGVDIIPNHADFRGLSSRALKILTSYPERNIFIRGLVRTIGLKSTEVYFDVNERFAGESKYTLSKMLNFAIDGITSFSIRPLRIITLLGVISVVISGAEMVYALVVHAMGKTIVGWTSLLVSIWFLGGLILICLGIIGEYIGKIYKEVKRRPIFIVETVV